MIKTGRGSAAGSFGIWFSLVNQYGIRSDKVPLDDAQRVLTLQRLEIGLGVAFLVSYAISVVDMRRNYKPQTRVKIDESQLPPEHKEGDKPAPTKPKQTSLRERILISPMVTPDSVGIGIGWEN